MHKRVVGARQGGQHYLTAFGGGLWALGLSSRSEEGLRGLRSASLWGSQAQAHRTHPRTKRRKSGVYTS